LLLIQNLWDMPEQLTLHCSRESVEDTLGYTIIARLSLDGPQCVKSCFMIKILEK